MNELGNKMKEFLEQVQQLNNQIVTGQFRKEDFLQQLKDLRSCTAIYK